MERLFAFKNTIDDTPKVVARDFINKFRPTKTAPKPRLVESKPLPTRDTLVPGGVVKLRDLAREMFADGFSAGEVAAQLEITYANAHYHLRAFRKAGGDIGKKIGA